MGKQGSKASKNAKAGQAAKQQKQQKRGQGAGGSRQTMPPRARRTAKSPADESKTRAKAKAASRAAAEPVEEEPEAYNRLIIVGSSRVNGRSAALAQLLFDTCLEEYPEDAVTIASVASLTIGPCKGCDVCRKGDCVIGDDMDQVLDLVEAADEVIVVSPVYFAGPPAQFKALLDRLQPFFWTDARHGEARPLTLHIIGEGHDPFGYDPLVTCVSSAFYCAGFELDQIFDWVGKIDAKGEITADPDVFVHGDADAEDARERDDDDADDDDFEDVDRDGLPDSEELREF